MSRVPFALIGLALLVACSGSETQEEATVAAGPDSVAIALESYDPAMFDTVAWKTDTAQTNRGKIVWTFSCKKCHGETGRGDAAFVMNGDTLKPADFSQPGWRFATDKAELIKYVFGGNAQGMPHWGIQGLKPRDIDAVSAYIQKELAVPAATPES